MCTWHCDIVKGSSQHTLWIQKNMLVSCFRSKKYGLVPVKKETDVSGNLRLFKLLSLILFHLQPPRPSHLNLRQHYATSKSPDGYPAILGCSLWGSLAGQRLHKSNNRRQVRHLFCITAPPFLVALWLYRPSSQWVKNLSACIHHAAPQLALISKGGERHNCEQHSVPWSTFSPSDWALVGHFSNTSHRAYFVFLSIIQHLSKLLISSCLSFYTEALVV